MPFRNAHVNTIFPALFRKRPVVPFVRERIGTPDDDFLDIDYLRAGNRRVAFLLHGLEGDTRSQYIRGTADILFRRGWDIAAVNHRSCSGEMNLQRRLYHSGVTDDPHTVVQHLKRSYEEIAMVGFSLGGNMTLKYLGEQHVQVDPVIRRAVAISVPVDLASCSERIVHPSNRVYDKRFLKSLRRKVHAKHRQFPDHFRPEFFKHVRNLRDFDEYYTAPIHGFEGAEGYYRNCSSLPVLDQIRIPTLLINAKDDPLLGETCYPYDVASRNPHFYLMTPRYGGHVGFTVPGHRNYWVERKIALFLEGHSFEPGDKAEA